MAEMQSRSVKFLKHSTRLFLQAIVGPKSISVSRAWMFHCFLDQPYMYRSKSAQRWYSLLSNFGSIISLLAVMSGALCLSVSQDGTTSKIRMRRGCTSL